MSSKDGKRELSQMDTINALKPYLWPSKRKDLQKRVIYAFILLIAGKIATILSPYVYKWATDALVYALEQKEALTSQNLQDFWHYPVMLTVLYGILRILMALFTQWRDGVFAKVALYAVREIALKVFRHVHALSLRFHLEKKTGALTRLLERGRDSIERLSRLITLQLLPTVLEFLLILAILWVEFRFIYAFVVALMVAAYLAFTFYATQWRISIRKKMNDSDLDANVKAVDSLLNFETVKYFCAEEREAKRYDSAMQKFEETSVQTLTSLSFLNFGQAFIFTVGLIIIMVFCVQDIASGRSTIGGFVMINAMMTQLYIPLNLMGMLYRDIKQALIDIHDLFVLLDENPEVRDLPDAQALKIKDGTIRFENVRFSYTEDRPILKGVTFEVPAGKTVAIVGPSGAGKSTISRLLFRFYEPCSGKITIDGQDIASVTQSSLRQSLGMVPQDTVLFNDTIFYNIRYGRWDATEEEVREAARFAQIDDFINSLPQGYKTQVGERGLKLSGGEKQRVAIARTILKAPPLLVLDEATSALDTFTEQQIQESLYQVSKGRTTLVIAHRLSTIISADEIIVLDKGVVIERGNHSSLLNQNGLYAALWERQREVDEARKVLKEEGEEG